MISNQSQVLKNNNQSVSNVSILLDSLLKDYDNSLRPDFGGVAFWGFLKMVTCNFWTFKWCGEADSAHIYFFQTTFLLE